MIFFKSLFALVCKLRYNSNTEIKDERKYINELDRNCCRSSCKGY